MHPKFLEILCCPKTKNALRLKAVETLRDGTVRTGALFDSDGLHRYPIINGIPRFVDKEFYANSFGYEWHKWPRVQFESANLGKKTHGHTTRMFETVTGLVVEGLTGKLVVEFGCGPGRFLDLVRRGKGLAVGIDMSLAVESARSNFENDSNVLIVQGDILEPPFKESSFDIGYSIGVLHHTPNPARGLMNLARVVKPDGLVACTVYPKEGFYNFPSVARFRRMYRSSQQLFGNKIALGYAYFSAYVIYYLNSFLRKNARVRPWVEYVERNILVTLDIPDARWRVLDVFDAITPFYASTHSPEEVFSWFAEAGCYNVTPRPWGTASFIGQKSAEV